MRSFTRTSDVETGIKSDYEMAVNEEKVIATRVVLAAPNP